MIREDLFIAIGDADDTCLARCEKYNAAFPTAYLEDADAEFERKIRHGRIRNALLIAAIILLMLLLMGSAIAALVTMRVEDVQLHVQSGGKTDMDTVLSDTLQESEDVTVEETYKGEKISFEDVHDVFIELGTYYPQDIPEGYTMTFVSNDAPLQNQVIHYENDAGKMIKFWIYIGDPASSVEIYGIEEKTDVEINGLPGILYKQKGGSRMLVWIDKSQGYGFVLSVEDPAVDILAMAKSTAQGDPLAPSRSEETLKALEELGDSNPGYLPEGFAELNVAGSPLAEGKWYSYVRKWYVNKAENTNIYFEYETYKIVTEHGYTDDARTACSFFIPGYKILKGKIVGEEVTVNGMFGIVSTHDIAWADPETHRVYHLHSKDISPEELLKIAQSITERQ